MNFKDSCARHKRKADVKNNSLSPPYKLRIVEDKSYNIQKVLNKDQIRDERIKYLQEKLKFLIHQRKLLENKQKYLLEQQNNLKFQCDRKQRAYESLNEKLQNMDCLKEKLQISDDIIRCGNLIKETVTQYFRTQANMGLIIKNIEEILQELIKYPISK